jgi:hypothetical protein
MQNIKNPYIETKASRKDKSRLVRSVVLPVIIFFLSIISINIFKNFGRLLMAPLIGSMWIVGALCAVYMPSMRKEIINQTLIAVATYCASLLGFRELIALTQGVSGQMLVATFGQPMATATANTVPGYLQNALWLFAAMFPLGFLGMQGKRLLQFKRNTGKMKKLEQLRGIRRS